MPNQSKLVLIDVVGAKMEKELSLDSQIFRPSFSIRRVEASFYQDNLGHWTSLFFDGPDESPPLHVAAVNLDSFSFIYDKFFDQFGSGKGTDPILIPNETSRPDYLTCGLDSCEVWSSEMPKMVNSFPKPANAKGPVRMSYYDLAPSGILFFQHTRSDILKTTITQIEPKTGISSSFAVIPAWYDETLHYAQYKSRDGNKYLIVKSNRGATYQILSLDSQKLVQTISDEEWLRGQIPSIFKDAAGKQYSTEEILGGVSSTDYLGRFSSEVTGRKFIFDTFLKRDMSLEIPKVYDRRFHKNGDHFYYFRGLRSEVEIYRSQSSVERKEVDLSTKADQL